MPADIGHGGVSAVKLPPTAGGLSADVDPPRAAPSRPNGGIAAGADEGGGLAAVAPAGVAPMAALRPMPLDGCDPSAGGGLSAVAKPREDCLFAAQEEGSVPNVTREAT